MGKSRKLSMPLQLVWCYVLILPCFCESTQYESEAQLGKAAKGRLGSLYHLRNKLVRSPTVSLPESKSAKNDQMHFSSTGRRILYTPSTNHMKESRGYSFHHSSSDITNPMFTQSYSTRDFHSRMGKVSDSSGGGGGGGSKWKSPEKSMDKYIKYAYKVDTSNNDSGNNNDAGGLNSFNIYQLDSKNSSQDSKGKVKQVGGTSGVTQSANSAVVAATAASTSTTTSSTVVPPTKKPSFSTQSTSGIDISPLKAIGQGLNTAMTTVLTQKLMGIIDQEVPQGFLNPLKHLVSSGQRMVEFWDKRTNARDGKGAPGIVEMFGYGIEQLKKYRDGQPMLPSDPIANLTSASKAMIQGMMVVKKLTNRVLGYDTDEQQAVVESRGGYDHGGWGWGHHVSYGHYLDPYAILATLGFGVFLFNVIFNLLNNAPANNAMTGRSLDVADIDIPLALSDIVSNGVPSPDKIFGTPTIRSRRSVDEDNPFYNSVVDKLEGMYKTYKTVTGNPSCAKLYMCRAAIQNPTGDDNSLLSQLYGLGLGQLSGDMSSISWMRSVKRRVSSGEDVDCESEVKGCEE